MCLFLSLLVRHFPLRAQSRPEGCEGRQTISGREKARLSLVERPQLFTTPTSSIDPGLPAVRAFRFTCFKVLSVLRGIGRSGASSNPHCVVLHDPSAERPHDLDDPFFEKEVQERIGGVIASAAHGGRKAESGRQ